MIYLYYRKSIDKMLLADTSPDPDWEKNSRDARHQCELYLPKKNIVFKNAFLTLVPAGKEQTLVAYALRVDAIGEPGDEYDD